MKKAQVSMFVLLGFIILLLVGVSIYVYSNYNSVNVNMNKNIDKKMDPELAAEANRMQERFNNCLGNVAKDAIKEYRLEGITVTDSAEVEKILSSIISMDFPNCAYKFNTESKTEIVDGQEPEVEATLSETNLMVTVNYKIKGVYNDQSYELEEYYKSIETDLFNDLKDIENLKNDLNKPDSNFISKEPDGTYINPYALEDEGKYMDAIFYDDGSCTVIMYDYSEVDPEQEVGPKITKAELENCVEASR